MYGMGKVCCIFSDLFHVVYGFVTSYFMYYIYPFNLILFSLMVITYSIYQLLIDVEDVELTTALDFVEFTVGYALCFTLKNLGFI